jgi:hypothetical protein
VTCASRRPAEKKRRENTPERGAHARTTPWDFGISNRVPRAGLAGSIERV